MVILILYDILENLQNMKIRILKNFPLIYQTAMDQDLRKRSRLVTWSLIAQDG